MLSDLCIRRPVLATVMSIIIVIVGLVAIRSLPVEQFPDVVPPTVSVMANYPGASSQVVADSVAAPLEQAINGVEGMMYISSSSSSNGMMMMSVTFKIGTDADQATINVNNRVQQVLSSLPAEVRALGVNVQKRSSNFLQVISLYSPDDSRDSLFLHNYALLNVVDELKRVEGVGDASPFGAGEDYAMRIWLRPDKMTQLKITPTDVATAIREQNAQFAPGKIGAAPNVGAAPDFTYTLTTKGRLSEPEEFENIMIRSLPDGSAVRLKDIARVELGAYSYDIQAKYDGHHAIAIGVYLAQGANQVATAEAVDKVLKEVKQNFPSGVDYGIPYDTTEFVQVSINEVISTLIEAMVLVFAVVYLFLQNWRATLIPCLAVPVSVIGTFGGMIALGFSINTLTLFGLVLAIGIVVDDAIVVLENVERIMSTKRISAKEASLEAMREVSGALVSIVLVLCSVFIPVAFVGGFSGEMYKQFAITIAISVSISGFVALTLTPALCSLILKEEHFSTVSSSHKYKSGVLKAASHMRIRFFRRFNIVFDQLTHRYSDSVRFLIKRSSIGVVVLVAMTITSIGLIKMLPSSLAPNEDQGVLMTAVFLPDGAHMGRTVKSMDEFSKLARSNENVEHFMSVAGFDILSSSAKSSAGIGFMKLKPWNERKGYNNSSFAINKDLFGRAMAFRDAFYLVINPPPISGMSNTGGVEAYIQSRSGGSPQELGVVIQDIVSKLSERQKVTGVNSTYSTNVPQVDIQLDREKARAQGVPVNDVYATLQSTLGAYYVNDFNKFGRTYKVQIQADAPFRQKMSDLQNIYVRSMAGEMIPVTSLVTVTQTVGPEVMTRFNLFPAGKITADPLPGGSTGDAIAELEAVAAEILPDGYELTWSGTAYQEKISSGSFLTVLAFGMLLVYLILAAQYERWTLPAAVALAVPFAVFGAVVLVLIVRWLSVFFPSYGGLANDVYFQVALVTLVGLAAKNAILIVEFAVQQMQDGHDIDHAAATASHLRFRPILMTSMAFIGGVLPLALSSGAGANSRHALGVSVIGGMLAATFIAILFIPSYFSIIMKLVGGKRNKEKTVTDDLIDHQDVPEQENVSDEISEEKKDH